MTRLRHCAPFGVHSLLLALSISALSPAPAHATYPERPVTIVVPFAPGGANDIVARIIQQPLGEALGQPIVIENRGGAGGTIGAQAVHQAPADGYTLLVASSGHSATPVIYPRAPFDPAADFSAIALFGSVPNVTVIAPSKGIKSIAELAAASKKSNLTFASSGAGSATHWAAERLRLAAGIDATHVPFRGGPEALTEVMTGRVDFMSVGVSSGLPFIHDGKLLASGSASRIEMRVTVGGEFVSSFRADGLIIEVHCDPDHALSDGAQSMFPAQFDRLMAELRIIAPAIGRSICLEPVRRGGWGS